MGCTLVLDVGKSATKLAALAPDGALLELLRRDNEAKPGPPYPSLDVEGIFAFAREGLARLAAGREVDAIVPVAHGAAAALVAGDALALPVLDYEFPGVAELDAEYESLARDFARTYSPRLPAGLNLGRQLAWLERRFPDEVARTTDLLLLPQYFAWRLAGAKVSEVTSLGCHTDLWLPLERAPSRFARERGWAARLPPLVPAWTRVGAHRGAPVLAGVHDSNASYLVHRAGRADAFTVVSTGTWFVCMARGAPLARLREDRDSLANVDVFGEPVACARFMGGRMFEAGASAEALARETASCLELLAARGELVIEGPFARNVAYRAALAALRPEQPVTASADATGTLGGALVLARLSAGQPRRLIL